MVAPILSLVEAGELMWIRQGGAMPAAKEGVFQLAAEIAAFVDASTLVGPWKVWLPNDINRIHSCQTHF